VTLFRIAPLKAYFGYFRYDHVPSDPHRWSYFWDEKGRGPVVVLRFLERTSKYVAPSTMSMATPVLFRVVAEYVFFGIDLTPEIAIPKYSKIFHDKH
jgi:hypothetical protein